MASCATLQFFSAGRSRCAATARSLASRSEAGTDEGCARWKGFPFCTLNTVRIDTPSREAISRTGSPRARAMSWRRGKAPLMGLQKRTIRFWRSEHDARRHVFALGGGSGRCVFEMEGLSFSKTWVTARGHASPAELAAAAISGWGLDSAMGWCGEGEPHMTQYGYDATDLAAAFGRVRRGSARLRRARSDRSARRVGRLSLCPRRAPGTARWCRHAGLNREPTD